MIGWLPSLRWEQVRWWLPLSETAAHVLAGCLMMRGQSRRAHDENHQTLLDLLNQDPSLFLYAALHQSTPTVSPVQLADWLLDSALELFAAGDARLGAPPITPQLVKRYDDLRSYFRTIPINRWLNEAKLLVELASPAVPDAWQQTWPAFDFDDANGTISATHKIAPSVMLEQLAALVKQQQTLEESFQTQLRRQKLAAIKQLAYGLSHEINNPLTNISTRAQQLQRSEQDANRHAVLQRIIFQTYRAYEMIADLMFYANPPDPEPDLVDLRTIVSRIARDSQELCQQLAVRLRVELPDEPAMIRVDDTMIGELLRCLVRNAIDAIQSEGTIVISVSENPDTIRIHIADSGPGLSEAARQHAFDPYFSGREAGRGLGLGLCRAYRIARLHHGDIALTSAPAGCVATVTLPKS